MHIIQLILFLLSVILVDTTTHVRGDNMVCFMRIFLMTSIVAGLASCAWVGETAGKAQAKIERKTQAVESGYQRGYEEEKAKTAKKEHSEAPKPPDIATQ